MQLLNSVLDNWEELYTYRGDYMEPAIKDGDVVLLAEWTERFIDWVKPYLVVTRSGYRCIKYIFPSKKKGHITCRSENSENHPEYNIDRSEVVRLFLVRGRLNYDFI